MCSAPSLGRMMTTTNTVACPEGHFLSINKFKSWFYFSFMHQFYKPYISKPYLAQLVVISQILFILAAGLGTYQRHVAVVFNCGSVAVGGLQFMVEGGGCEAQRVQVEVLVSGCD